MTREDSGSGGLNFWNRREDLRPVVSIRADVVEYAPAKGVGWRIPLSNMAGVVPIKGFWGFKGLRLVGWQGQELGVIEKFAEVDGVLEALVERVLADGAFAPVRSQFPADAGARACLVAMALVVRPPWTAVQADAEMVLIATGDGLWIRKVREEVHQEVRWRDLDGIYERPRTLGGSDARVYVGLSTQSIETPFPTLAPPVRAAWEEAWKDLASQGFDPFRLEYMYASVYWDKNRRGMAKLTDSRLRWGPMTFMDLDDISDLAWNDDAAPLGLRAQNRKWYELPPFQETPDLVDALLARLLARPFFDSVRDRLPVARLQRMRVFRLAARTGFETPWLDLMIVGDEAVVVLGDSICVSQGRDGECLSLRWQDIVGLHHREARGFFSSNVHGRIYYRGRAAGFVDLPLPSAMVERLDRRHEEWLARQGAGAAAGLPRVAAFRDGEQRDFLCSVGVDVWGRGRDRSEWSTTVDEIGWVTELDPGTGFTIHAPDGAEITHIPAFPEIQGAFDRLTELLWWNRRFDRVRGTVTPRVEDRAGLIWLMAHTPGGYEWDFVLTGEGSVAAISGQGLLLKPTRSFESVEMPWSVFIGYEGRNGRWRFFRPEVYVEMPLSVLPQAVIGVLERQLDEHVPLEPFRVPALPCVDPQHAISFSFELEQAVREGLFSSEEYLVSAAFGVAGEGEGESVLTSVRAALDTGVSRLSDGGGLSLGRISAAGLSAASNLVGRRKRVACELFLTDQRLLVVLRESGRGQGPRVEAHPVGQFPRVALQDDILALDGLKVRVASPEMAAAFYYAMVRHFPETWSPGEGEA